MLPAQVPVLAGTQVVQQALVVALDGYAHVGHAGVDHAAEDEVDETVAPREGDGGGHAGLSQFRLDDTGRVQETLFPLRDRTGCHRSLEIYVLSKELLLNLVDECMSHDLASFRGAVLQAKARELHIKRMEFSTVPSMVQPSATRQLQQTPAGST